MRIGSGGFGSLAITTSVFFYLPPISQSMVSKNRIISDGQIVFLRFYFDTDSLSAGANDSATSEVETASHPKRTKKSSKKQRVLGRFELISSNLLMIFRTSLDKENIEVERTKVEGRLKNLEKALDAGMYELSKLLLTDILLYLPLYLRHREPQWVRVCAIYSRGHPASMV